MTTRDQLAGAARASLDDRLTLDDFMKAAWAAYTEARPGLKEYLEDQAMLRQLDQLRARGQVARA